MSNLRERLLLPGGAPGRRGVLLGLSAALTVGSCIGFVGLSVGTPSVSEAAADQPARFMRRVARELMAASRSGSADELARVIYKRGDVQAIGMFSLGSYSAHVPQKRKLPYYSGMSHFMARYFLAQAKNYPVARIRITGPSERYESGYRVASDVMLENGSTYDVRWFVVKNGDEFKVRDAQALGYWLTPFQRRLFVSYIKKHGGDVNALLYALGS